MMNPGTITFTVRVREHNVSLDKYRELIEDGLPFGDAGSAYPPKMVETFNIDPPQEDTVRYLAFFASIEDKSHSNISIIRMMDEANVWKYNPKEGARSMQSCPTRSGGTWSNP